MDQTDAPRKPSFLRRIGILLGTVATIGLAGLLVVSGSDVIAERAAAAPSEVERAAVSVETVAIKLQETFEISTTYRGAVESGRFVSLGFETGGTIAEIQVDEGDLVAKGDRLAALDTDRLDAQRAAEVAARDALIAQVELAKRTADRQRELKARDFASDQRLDEAELTHARLQAEVRRAEAAIAATDVAIEKSVIYAPFDARVGERQTDEGSRVAGGQAVLNLFEATEPRFRVGVPEDVANALQVDTDWSVDFGPYAVPATLLRKRGDIDPATRTRDLIFALPSEVSESEGALGAVTLARNIQTEGAWVPTTVLSEGVKGLWTIFVIKDGTAVREAVELIHTDGSRAFVRGHFKDGDLVVAYGAHRIATGQSVVLAGS